MKTPITFEKDDILKLVYVFLKKKGFDIPSPDKVMYKGALQVTINIEHELATAEVEGLFEVAAPSPPPRKRKTEAPPPPLEGGGEDEPDMDDILSRSRGIGATGKAPFDPHRRGGGDDNNGAPERPLGANESYEFPRDE